MILFEAAWGFASVLFSLTPRLRPIENAERLQGQHQEVSGGPGLTRRVSRVESLRRLLLGASQQEARRLFDRRKQRYTVDKAIGEFQDIHRVIHNNRLKVREWGEW